MIMICNYHTIRYTHKHTMVYKCVSVTFNDDYNINKNLYIINWLYILINMYDNQSINQYDTFKMMIDDNK